MNIASNSGDHEFQTKEEAADFIRKSASNSYDDIWIYGEEEYPCLAMLVNGDLACVHYFLNDQGDMWQSVGTCEEEVAFGVYNEAPGNMPGECVISLDEAIACMNQFFDTLQRPDCIEWREL